MAERVIVFGVDSPIGLAVCRDLHRHGVEVFAIGRNRFSLGLHSSSIAWGTVFPGPAEAMVPFVRDVARQHGVDKLMTVSEPDILRFNAARATMPEVRMLFPSADRMALVLDKRLTLAAADRLGIATPRTFEPGAPDDIDRIEKEIVFPVVLKWPDPNAVSAALAAHGLPLRKLEYCLDRTSLRSTLERYATIGRFPMVQEYARGVGLGQMIFMHDGRPLLTFQHRRIREWPPEGGFATTCVSVGAEENQALMQKSVALLRSIDWDGTAMVEYRYDRDSGRFVLMEINGRFWGSLPLACHAGASFPWYQYSVLGCGRIPESKPYRPGVRCTYMIPEVKRLARILFRPGAIPDPTFRYSVAAELRDFLLMFLDFRRTFYVFAWKDPMPFLWDMWGAVTSVFGRLGRRAA